MKITSTRRIGTRWLAFTLALGAMAGGARLLAGAPASPPAPSAPAQPNAAPAAPAAASPAPAAPASPAPATPAPPPAIPPISFTPQPSSPTIDALRQYFSTPAEQRKPIAAQAFFSTPLTMVEAEQAQSMLWDDFVATHRAEAQKEWDAKSITIGTHTMRLLVRQFGDKPADGWNLYISMHGGGNAPPEVNDEQWQNQIKLYQPRNAIYVAPRAPTNTWNLWHEAHIDPLFARLIEDAVIVKGVNPNRVYLMGYSAGGDGVYQLAPRMADRWAAASMMAGHPNDASPLGLRDLPFTIHVGALDNGYGRNKVAAEWKIRLDDLQKADPKGYIHEVQLHAGRAHGMNLEDSVAVDWMAKFTRNTTPDKVVWKQSTVTHDRFYWLGVPPKDAKAGALVIASRKGQTIDITTDQGAPKLIVMFNDKLVDLDKPVVITSDGKELFNGKLSRTIEELSKTLDQRADPDSMFSASQTVQPPNSGMPGKPAKK